MSSAARIAAPVAAKIIAAPSGSQSIARKPASPSGRARIGTLLSPRIQPAMRISSPNDPAEREAETIARNVMQMSVAPTSRSPSNGVAQRSPARTVSAKLNASPLLRQAAGRQSAAGQTASADVASDIAAARGSGAPLPENLRRFMEPRFRADFSPVRIHTDGKAAQLARRVNARAFTVGRDIFFGANEFRPDSRDGAELVAHELTHTIQQSAAIQRSEAATVEHRSAPQVQRLGLSDALDYFADKANLIPGFRMFTLVLGVNPINMKRVERSGANILRALVELIPGGALIVQALDMHGVFEKAGGWLEQQVATLGLTGASIRAAIDRFLDSLGWRDIFDLGGVWDRAKAIFTEPIRRLIDFGKSVAAGVIKFIKDAVLMPLAKLAQGTRGWDLLCAVLGRNPITGEAVPQTAETLVGGFMKFIGQEDVWKRIQETGAIPKVWAWFTGALATVKGFVAQLPALALAAFHALEVSDFLLLPRAIGKIVGVFGNFAVQFVTWAGNAVWNLLEIVFSVVSPGAWTYIKKTGAALKSILKNPLPFVGNLVKAAKAGFDKFAGNFLTHLKAGMIEWLVGSLPGIYIPKAFEFGEIAKFVMSALGLTWANIRAKLVKVIGEPAMAALETTFDIVVTLVREGPAAAWDKIQQQLTNLKDMVIGGITDFIKDTVVKKAIPKLVAMFIPGAGFISAIISIYETVMVFVEKIARIIQVVTAFLDSIVAIAGGAISAAANRVESILAGLLSLAISFLAGFVGLGRVSDKIMGVLEKVRKPIDKALDWLVNWIVTAAKKLLAKLTGRKDKDGGDIYSMTRKAVLARLGGRASPARSKTVAKEVLKELAPSGLKTLDVIWSEAKKSYVFDASASPGKEIIWLAPSNAQVIMYSRVVFEGSPTEGIGETFLRESRETLDVTLGQPVARPAPPPPPPGLSARDDRGHRKPSLVVVQPRQGSPVLETASWNAGGAVEGSNVSHAESQFADWITGRQRTASWRGRIREVDIHISHSPCDHCAPDLASLANMLPNAKVLRIRWDQLYVDPKGKRSTSPAGLARLSKWQLIGDKPTGYKEPTDEKDVKAIP